MIKSLYPQFQYWSLHGSLYMIGDTHFDDKDCLYMDPFWITPEKQVEIINNTVGKHDILVHLGDVGDVSYMSKIKAEYKILIMGNHDKRSECRKVFDEIYTGPLFIADRILLSHEPVTGLPWCLNIHGHDHNNMEKYEDGCKHLNLAANVCNYTPVSLKKIIKDGILSDIKDIHRATIDYAKARKNNV